MGKYYLLGVVTALAVSLVATPAIVSGQEERAAAPAALSFGDPSVYLPLTESCVLFDTRESQGGTGALAAGETRKFSLVGDLTGQGGDAGCAVSSGGFPVEAYHLNLVAIDPAGAGNLKAWGRSRPEPNGGIVNFSNLSTMNNSNAFNVQHDTAGLNVKANGASVHVRGVLFGEFHVGSVYYAPAP